MDVKQYKSWANPSEEETAHFFQNLGLSCVDLNWKMKNTSGQMDDGEIDGIFQDEQNQLYIIYDDSTQENDRQDKISKFLNKWKNVDNQAKLRANLNLKNYPIYVVYIDKSGKKTELDSIKYTLDEKTKIIYTSDYDYFKEVYENIGRWVKNDLYNFLEVKPKKVTKEKINAVQIYIGDIPAYIFADRTENILGYTYISRRRDNDMGYQRMVDKRRVKAMSDHIKSGKINSFPNSILLNCVDNIDFIPKSKTDCPCSVSFDLPNMFSSCRVVDGQHRLAAFSKLDSTIQDSHSLPIVLFHNMQLEQEIKTFIEINDNQKGIDPNLIYSLKSDMNFQVGSKELLEKISVDISKKLSENSPYFKNNIFFGNSDEKRAKKITLTTIVESIIEFKIVDYKKGWLQEDEKDSVNPFEKINEIVQLIIKIDKSNHSFYSSNNGVRLILKFVSIFHRNVEKGNITITLEDGVKEFSNTIINNKMSLPKKYGKAGFSAISNTIFEYMKKNIVTFSSFQYDLKQLK